MRPVDPRLLRYARSTRRFLVLAVVLGVVTAVLVITQARLLSSVIVDVTANGLGWAAVASSVLALACVFAARAAIAWLAEIAAFRSSARAKQELRSAAFAHVLELGPAGPGGVDPGGVAALITRGVDGLDGYFARYLPQLVLAVIVPVAVLLTILGQDLLSPLIIAVTLPLIPVFMILIGIYTRGRVDRQWGTLAVLSGHFLDLVAGLPTLKVFGRAKAQAAAIRAIGDEYRSTTMGVLRISFLSSLALELLATLSVALVAVSVGLRLAEGQIAYSVALFVLVLAPEAYLPLRLVGQHFHAAAEGLGAADRMFQLLETPPSVAGGTHAVHHVRSIEVADVTVTFPGRAQPALTATSFTADRGTVTAIVGPSGGGKTTLMQVLMGFAPAGSGRIVIDGEAGRVPLEDIALATWRERIGWVPQRPVLVGPDLTARVTVGDAVRLGAPAATDDEVWAALSGAGIADELPAGLTTQLQADGSGLSAGQLQRIALARALVRRPDVLLLDEPTAALDGASERAVTGAVRRAADDGAIVIVVAHRPALVALADQVVRVGGAGTLAPSPSRAAIPAFDAREEGW